MYRIKTIKKYTTQKMLERAGFKAWMIPRDATQLYAMVIIACNRLCPERPELAYVMLKSHLCNTHLGCNTDCTKWRCAERESKESIRLASLKLQSQSKDMDHCPVCNGLWHETVEVVDNGEDITCDLDAPGFVAPPDMSQFLPQSADVEAKPTRNRCGDKDVGD